MIKATKKSYGLTFADMPNKETMSSIYEAIADMSDHHLKVASSYEELEKILDEK